ncbi:MAG: DinB family protein [Segniliparus sp.]|uniref:DinB family protein n=1 Tax=Segniliparus sp. TaxID=2804064 RepID=UPI003F32782D
MAEAPIRPHAERDILLDILAVQRQSLIASCHGLGEEQARATPTASSLSLGGLVKHAAFGEQNWISLAFTFWAPGPRPQGGGAEAFEKSFQLGEDETLAGAVASLRLAGQLTEAYFRAIPAEAYEKSLPMPAHPWLSVFQSELSPRWILAHLVDEHSRHAGHADIIRESLDGAKAYPLWRAALGLPPE